MPLKKAKITLLLVFLFLTPTSCIRHKLPKLEILRSWHAEQERAFLDERHSVIDHPLTLQEMIDIALCCNLDLYVQEQEILISCSRTKSELLKLLPTFNAHNLANDTSQQQASFSQSLVPGVPPAPLSTSTDKFLEQYDLTLSWSILDFGMAYFQSRQARNAVMIRSLQYQRMRNKVILDVVSEYWKAIAGKLAIEGMQELLVRTREQNALTSQHVENQWISDIEGLIAEDRIIEAEKEMIVFKKAYHAAMGELSRLMGLPPGVQFEFVLPEIAFGDIDLPPIESLEDVALINRFELYEKDVEEFVYIDDAKKALVQMCPNLRLYQSPHFNSNSFLLHNFWIEFGAELVFNVLQIPSRHYEREMAFRQCGKVIGERLAISLGVLTQVNLSYLIVQDYLEEYRIAEHSHRVRKELYQAVLNRVHSGERAMSEAIAFEAEAYLAKMQMFAAFANLKGAIEQLNNAIGCPLYLGEAL